MTTAPFYEDSNVTLYLGRAEDVLPTLAKASADLIVTDPPYGVNFRSNRGQNFNAIAGDESAEWVPDVLSDSLRVLRPFRHAYIFGPPEVVAGVEKLAHQSALTWDKGQVGMGDLSLPWGPQTEPITFGVFVPSAKNRADGYGSLAARMRRGSLITVPRKNSRAVNRHPTEKPTALLRQFIESSSCVGETVLDPFIGSGSTAVAAVLEGRRCVGIELDEAYLTTAAERCAAAHELMKGANDV